jgi:hypothetical protein
MKFCIAKMQTRSPLFSKVRANSPMPEEADDFIAHFDEKCQLLFIEILKASKIVPLMVEGLAKKEPIVVA